MLSKKIRAYKLAHPNAKTKEIATAVGCKPTYVYQVLHIKLEKVAKPTEGQQIVRQELTRLNKDIDDWRSLYLQTLDEVEQLKQDVVGYRAVISYLQGQIDGITV
jgi:hypothetical protein